MDYFRGVAEMANAIQANRSARLSTDFSLHVTELALAMQYPETMGTPRTLTTTFEKIDPMSWAK